MCEHSIRHVISHRGMCIDWFPRVLIGMMEHLFTITCNSVTRGYHIHENGWDAPIGKPLYCELEIGNHSDPCAVAVKRATLGPTKEGASLHDVIVTEFAKRGLMYTSNL